MRKTKFILTLAFLQGILLAQTWKPLGPFKYLNKDASTPNSIGNGAIYSANTRPNNPNIIFAGSNSGGLWKTVDGGAHWAACDIGFSQIFGINNIDFESINPDIIYLATIAGRPVNGLVYSSGIFRSTDGGASFQEVNNGLNFQAWDGTRFKRVLIDKGSSYPNTKIYTTKCNWDESVYAIYQSSNSGDSWATVTTFPQSIIPLFKEAEIDPQNGNYLYFASNNELWRTDDAMATTGGWTDLTSDLVTSLSLSGGVNVANIVIRTQQLAGYICALVFLSNGNICIATSTDYGSTWTKVFGPTPSPGFKGGFDVSEIDPETFYIGAVWNIWRVKNNSMVSISTDNIWDIYDRTVHVDMRYIQSVKIPNTSEHFLLCGNDGGLSRCNNPDEAINLPICPKWSYQGNIGLNNLHFYGLGSSTDGTRLAAGAQDASIFIYNQSDNSWKSRIWSDGGDAIFYPQSNSIIYAEIFGAVTYPTELYTTANDFNLTGNNISYLFGSSFYGDGSRPIYIHPSSKNFYVGYREILRADHSISITPTPTAISQFGTIPPIGAIAISESDENVIYVGKSWSDLVNQTQTPVIYKSTNALGTPAWTDITSAISGALRGVADIEINPNDKDKVYIGLRGLSLKSSTTPYNTIFYTSDGGANWVVIPGQVDDPNDINTSFPFQELYCLEYDRNSDRLYAGFQNGTFYFDMSQVNNSGAKWHRFMGSIYGTDMPAVGVTDLEINYAQGLIRAATFGRGIWESPLPCPSYLSHMMDVNDQVAYQNAGTINWHYSDFTIPAGYTLTVDNTVVKMPQNARFTIQKGGKLVIKNGAKITNGADNCAYMWDGIYVEADANLPQIPNAVTGLYPDHGFLVLENCTLEHAYMAVSAGYNNPGGSGLQGGGVVLAEGSAFLNNRFSARFYDFTFSNKSRVRDCSFKCTGSLPYFSDNDGAYSFVSLFGIKDMWLSGNTFENSAPGGDDNPFGSKFRGAGIISVNSTYWVTPSFNPSLYNGNCTVPNGVRTTFKGLTHGVFIYNFNNDPSRQAHILDCDFTDISMGIGMNWDTKTQVYGNRFNWTTDFDEYPYFSYPNS
ncbi:MAG: hypothetical protein IT281_09785, partial [Ignavibacteria bacterium]|nr:hypothetical protein [Ignavibacteria bacterium]